MNVLCLMGIHDQKMKDYWFPSRKAKVVTHCFMLWYCNRCWWKDWHCFDWKEFKKSMKED